MCTKRFTTAQQTESPQAGPTEGDEIIGQGSPLAEPEQQKTESPQAVPREIMPLDQMEHNGRNLPKLLQNL